LFVFHYPPPVPWLLHFLAPEMGLKPPHPARSFPLRTVTSRPYDPRKHLGLPSSRATPLRTCPGLRPRWWPSNSPLSCSGLQPSTAYKVSAFPPIAGLSLRTTTIHFSGLNTEPAILIPSAPDSRLRAYLWGSLQICWLSFNLVGLSKRRCQGKPCMDDGGIRPPEHPLGNNIEFQRFASYPNDSNLSRHE